MSPRPHRRRDPSAAPWGATFLLGAALLASCSPAGPQVGGSTLGTETPTASGPADPQPAATGGGGAATPAPPDDGRPRELVDYELKPGQSLDVVETFYPDGKPLLRREVLRDADGMVNHGLFQRWHPNGALAERGWYLLGLKQGPYLQVAETGLKESEVTYDHGKRQGPSTVWNDLGKIKEQAHYVADRLEGEFEQYGTAGLKQRGRYVAGKEEGPWSYWYPAGGKMEEGSYAAGKREGLWRSWYPGGPLKAEETFHEGVLDGPAVEYDEQGTKSAERSYKEGVPDGLQVEYHPDGTVLSEARYVAGRLEGLQRRWYPGGQLQVEGEMRDGKREGRWTYYDEDGTVNQAWSGEYRNDERVSG